MSLDDDADVLVAERNDELERAVAAEAVFSHERFIALGVNPDELDLPSCRAVVEAAQEVWELGEYPVSPESVALALQRAGKLAMLGGQRGLADLLATSAVPDVAQLRSARRLRILRERLARASVLAARGDLHGALELAGEAHENALSAVSMSSVRTAKDLAHELLGELSDDKHGERLIHPGLASLMRAIGPLEPGNVLIIAAGTNVGKTTFTLEMLDAIVRRGDTAGYVSVEDPDRLTAARLLSMSSGVSSARIRRRDLGAHDWELFSRGMVDLDRSGSRFLLANCMGGTELDVCAAMTRMRQRAARVVAVDYIGEIEASKRQQDRRNEIRWIAKRLKVHASRLGVALVLVSQLSRPKDGNPAREPTKHDLKEAGDLENSAENIIGLWRTEEDDYAPVHAKVLKAKGGGNGLRWTMQRERRGKNGEPGSARMLEVDNPEPWR